MRVSFATAGLVALLACGGPAAPSPAASPAPVPAPVGDAGVPPAEPPPVASPVDAGPPQPTPRGPTLAGCPMFPVDNAWNRDVSTDPVDPHSADYVAFMGSGLVLWPAFGGEYGQPFAVVPATQAKVPMSFLYSSQSDPGPYPFPADVPIEPWEDRHAVVLQQGECRLHETYNTYASGAGFHADSGAVFDLVSGAQRPDGWTSATAAGLPILPGLARYDEAVEQGEIRHALTYIAGATAHAWVAPATHSVGTSDAPWAPPMGLRVRLRADYDLSRFHGASLVVLRALQRYGMFITDNAGGQAWYLKGTHDARWSVPDLDQLKSVPASAFEVVKLGEVRSGL